MKNIITLSAIAGCLAMLSFTYLKEANLDQQFIHTVYFWLDDDLSDADRAEFEQALMKLGTIPQIKKFYWGPPAPTEKREVIDDSYDYAINVHFENIESHNVYQAHDLHLEFLKQAPKWTKVQVYDNSIK
jgi:hypothetical protein